MSDQFWVDTLANGLWNAANNWASISGGADNTGPPGAGDAVIFDNANVTNCTVDVATPELLSLTIGGTATGVYSGTITGSNKIQMTGSMVIEDGSTATFDLNADIDIDTEFTGDGAGVTVRCGVARTWTVGGNFDNKDVGTWARETSTLVMTGTGKTITSSDLKDLHNLTISAGITVSSATQVDVRGAFTVDGQFSASVGIQSVDGTVAINGGGVLTGTGTMTARSATITNSGTWSIANTNVPRTSTVGGGTYGGTWVLEAGSGTRTLILGTAGGQTLIFTGDVTYDMDVAGPDVYTVDLSTHNPDIEYRGDVTLSETGGGTLVYSKGTGINSITGAADQSLDFDNKAIEDLVINKTAGDITLTGWIQTDSFTGTSTGTGTFDPNGQTIAVAGNSDWAAAFLFDLAANSMDGSMWTVGGNFTCDGQTLNATATWYLQVTGTAVASGTGEVEYCDASGYTTIDASAGPWVNGRNNSNWNFGVIINQLQGANVGADLFNGALSV